MSKKNLTILLSVILIVAFFLPFISAGTSFSAFDIVFGKVGGLTQNGRFLFVSLLVPIGAILLLLGAFTNDSFTKSGIVLWMPFIGVLYLVVMLYINGSSDLTVSELIGWLGYGFWILLVSSFLLLFMRRTA